MIPNEKFDTAIQLFLRQDDTVAIWDHPNFKSSVALPDTYKPLTRVEEGLELINQGRLTKEKLTIMKVVGDALCTNENQLRRYLKGRISSTVLSKHLRWLAERGFVQRHKCRLAFVEEDGKEFIRPPSPFTLDIAGYKLLNHLYSEQHFASPDTWQQNSMAIQRYVAINEVRCSAVESRSIRGWTWYPLIGGSAKNKKPLASMRVKTPQGEVQFLLERLQMSQDFLGYLRTRLETYRYLFERDGRFTIDGYPASDLQVMALSVSSMSMAKFVHEELRLHTYPFDVWFIVDEWMDAENGLESACALVEKDGIKRIRVQFLKRQPQTSS